VSRDFGLGPRLGERFKDTLLHVLDLKPQGTALEFGVGSGASLRWIAARMPVIGFDSFQGLPETWRPGFEVGKFACKPPVIMGAQLVIGLFSDTLPGRTWPKDVGLVHIDCDLYSSTVTVLENVAPALVPGTYVVFDEYHGYDGYLDHELKAWQEFVDQTQVEWEVVGHGPEQWAIRITKAP
jgi:hypothetical protein